MNSALAAVSVAALAALAAAGVIAGFRRRDPVPMTALGDPLEDRRLALERSLSDLDEARATGALEDAEFVRLRDDTRERIERVARALAARDRRPASSADAVRREPARVPSWAVGVLLVAVIGAVVLTSLTREGASTPEATAPDAGSTEPIAFFEERVRANPEDVAARLDLGRRYLDAERFDEALEQYLAVLELDPDDAEAHAQIGLLLLFGERPEEALESVDTALDTAPDYPEALFYRGVILLEGLARPAEAIDAFERYLEVAPFGALRANAEEQIAEARSRLAAR
jgi:tetratricopeptide (TPR) repeat protein